MRLFGIRIDAKGSWTRSAVLLSDAIVPVSRSPLSSHTTTGGPGAAEGLGADAGSTTDGDGEGAGGTGCANDVAATKLAASTAAHRLTSGAHK